MTDRCTVMSQDTLDRFLAGDALACTQLTAYLLECGRRLRAGDEAEDLAQRLLLDLLLRRERDALALRSESQLKAYLFVSMRNRLRSSLRRRRPGQFDGDPESVPTSAADGPDGSMRTAEHLELCVKVMQHALEHAGASPDTWKVMQRIIERFVHGRDVEVVLIDCGLLKADASDQERCLARNTENRRQSRARATQIDALHQLAESVGSSTTKSTLTARSRIPFDADDVQCALRFVLALSRSERAVPSTSKANR